MRKQVMSLRSLSETQLQEILEAEGIQVVRGSKTDFVRALNQAREAQLNPVTLRGNNAWTPTKQLNGQPRPCVKP
jgi:hypothetical protein